MKRLLKRLKRLTVTIISTFRRPSDLVRSTHRNKEGLKALRGTFYIASYPKCLAGLKRAIGRGANSTATAYFRRRPFPCTLLQKTRYLELRTSYSYYTIVMKFRGVTSPMKVTVIRCYVNRPALLDLVSEMRASLH